MITDAQIQAEMACIEYHLFQGTTLVACCITLKNGYPVLGYSFFADPKDFEINKCQQFAFEDAQSKVGELLAYKLKENK